MEQYNINIKFTLCPFSCNEAKKCWKKFKESINKNFEFRDILIREWLHNCKINSNKNLPILQRLEGGMGGDDNRINKQIRFEEYNKYYSEYNKDTEHNIIFNVYNTEEEKWTLQELDDLIYGFEKCLKERYFDVNCCIELSKYNYDTE